MKVSFSWLKELVEISSGIDDISESLSMAGFEVDDLIDLSSAFNNIVIGYISEVKPHPNANKLNICSVNVGKTKYLQIVCGASNVEKDMHVLVALEGAYLKAVDLKIKESEIRGEFSQGMICSYEELGISSSSEGIAVLEELKRTLPNPGESPIKIFGYNDIILDLAITANRPDGMSMVGIAREVSAIKKSKLTLPLIEKNNGYKIFSPNLKTKDIKTETLIYSLHEITGLDGNIPSSWELQNLLKNIGLRSINAIVDITNYVMVEQGQPLHAFDADLLDKLLNKKVNQTDFGIRKAIKDELFIGIDDKEYKLNEKINVITCGDIAIAIAGVIGGANTAVNSKTNRVWLEAASFPQNMVRTSAREIGNRTESSSRFEKGVSSEMTIDSATRAIQLFKDKFDCNVKGRWINRVLKESSKSILLRKDRIDKILGVVKIDNSNSSKDQSVNQHEISSKTRLLLETEIEESLTLLGCITTMNKDGWDVKVPPNRTNDLLREIDLIEEIARLIGYDKFDSNLPDPIRPGGLSAEQNIDRQIKESFVSAGFQEVVTSSLVAQDKVNKDRIPIYNPLLSETSHMRNNLWEEHINICKRNIDFGNNGCWLFEVGKIYINNDKLIEEKSILGGAITGNRHIGQWQATSKRDSLDYFEARGLIESVFRSLKINIEDIQLESDLLFHPGKSSNLILEGKTLGRFGQIHPKIAAKYDCEQALYLFELDLTLILNASTRRNKLIPKFKKYATVPAMERDIALITDLNVNSAMIIKLIMKTGKPIVENVILLDKYSGSNLSQDQISQTFRITYRKNKETLKEEEMLPIHEKIIKRLEKELSVELRR
ncbi:MULTISPECIES: phenylalanine--tRNA ligase subunit beta [unclassified Prochlorococcus]|uniref:phenylalanine--tRNA ligase subunit beta n=1 Tax=unclassified Prochlorococcus TaxID=2627481 RepID=UPI000533B3DD|nr:MULTISPECIES: phenylalanine--tRNA ligase subunit beta [unclassified Prochlorococcus]KGG15288.1 Phenylalanyl-tRNA synthetase beta chain [Prochlorococcus sp. MIT 0602]KGG17566.1 Phenylalanyl-tRNA synthetase beta chain [Prochlorococcus sp. MIT 0603]